MPYPSSSLIAYIYKMAGAHGDDGSSDRELITRYADAQDEQAFSTLMVRHGPLVWSICHRILGNTQDVEEAYQTTFLALAHKAKKIRGETLVGWLHQVAHRTALNARRNRAVRRKIQQDFKDLSQTQRATMDERNEIYEELHGEIAKLPEKLRVPLVLHFLEGKTQVEVAQILGVTKSTVWDRLAQGEAVLGRRLSQKQLAVGAATAGAMLQTMVSQAAIPPGLVQKTTQAAAAFRSGKLTSGLAQLAREVVKQVPAAGPWWKSSWMITILCVTSLLGVGAGGVAWKAGFFGTKAEDPAIVSKQRTPEASEKNKQKAPRLDRYGDPLPLGALARLGTARTHQTDMDQSFLFTPDSKALVIYGRGQPARLCDLATGKLIRKFGSNLRVVALSRDGRILAGVTPGEQALLNLWDISTGRQLKEFTLSECGATALAISPDAKVVVAGGHQLKTSVWEIATGKMLWAKEQKWHPYCFAFSSDNRRLLEFGPEGARLSNIFTGKEILDKGPPRGCHGVAFACSSDARLAATANDESRPDESFWSVWEIGGEKVLQRVSASRKKIAKINAVAFSPDGKQLATANGTPGVIRLWDIASGKEMRPCLENDVGLIRDLAFSPNGGIIVANSPLWDMRLHVWDVHSGKQIVPHYDGHAGPVTSIAFSADGKELISGGCDGVFRAWIAGKGIARTQWGRRRDWTWARFVDGSVGPDARILAATEYDLKTDPLEVRRSAKIISLQDGSPKEICRFQLQPGLLDYVAFSPKGTMAVVNGMLLNESTGEILRSLPWGRTAFSADGNTLAACVLSSKGARSAELAIVDVHTGKTLCSFNVTDHDVRNSSVKVCHMAFSPDMRLLAVATTEGNVRLYPLDSDRKADVGHYHVLKSNHEPVRPPLHSRVEFLPLAFSPNGAMLATADESGGIHVWETVSAKERLHCHGHEGRIVSLAFAADGRRLASGGTDTTILIWDVTGGSDEGKLQAMPLSDQAAESLWADLLAEDAGRAAQAVWTLTAAGEYAVSFLGRRLKPILADAAEKTAARWISRLDDDAYAIRRDAQERLIAISEIEIIEAQLRRALQEKASQEKHRAMERLLEKVLMKKFRGFYAIGETVRRVRSIEVLEQIGTPKAQQVLQKLSAGNPNLRQTQAAYGALARLKANSVRRMR